MCGPGGRNAAGTGRLFSAGAGGVGGVHQRRVAQRASQLREKLLAVLGRRIHCGGAGGASQRINSAKAVTSLIAATGVAAVKLG